MRVRWSLLLLLGYLIYSDVQGTVIVETNSGEQVDIIGRAGCNYMRTCCASLSFEGWFFGQGGGRAVNSSNVFISEFTSQAGDSCGAIFLHPAESGSLVLTCIGATHDEIVSTSLNVNIAANSSALQISVSGSSQKNITGMNVGEIVTVGCQVESCLNEPYSVIFKNPDGSEFSTQFGMAMTMGFSATVTLKNDMSGEFSCEVLDSQNRVQSSASFAFIGTPGLDPPTDPPTRQPTPRPPTCPSTQGRDIALGVVFAFLGMAAAVAVVAVVVAILCKFTHVFDFVRPRKNIEPLRNERDADDSE